MSFEPIPSDRRTDHYKNHPSEPAEMHPAGMAVCDIIQPTPHDKPVARVWDRSQSNDTDREILVGNIAYVYDLEEMA